MPSLVDERALAADGSAASEWNATFVRAARIIGPPLLFGFRLWAAVCLALYVAFSLELDNAYWAGTSTALVSQPHLGASLRKGWFRMIGTLVGAVAIVLLTALFPQDRASFLVGLALWGAACALVATLLRNFAAYSAALAGYTAAIIASDELGATGGVNGEAFMLAITRVSEIWIGIVCAGIVLAGTDFGAARHRLAALFAALSAEIATRSTASLALVGSAHSEAQPVAREDILQQPVRRELIRKVIGLDPVIDEVIGESPSLRYHSSVLQTAVAHLFAALSSWRSIVVRLARLSDKVARHDADAVLRQIPPELRPAPVADALTPWMTDPVGMRRLSDGAVRKLIALPADTPSLRLLADQAARLLAGLSHVFDGLALLVGDKTLRRRSGAVRVHVPDWLPPAINAGRAFVTIAAVEIFWIVTAWPNGALAITWAAILVILFAPRAEQAYAVATSFMLGTVFASVCAAVIAFAALPNVQTFAGFSLWIGLFLVPAGALMAQPWETTVFAAMAGNFVPLLAPANPMNFDAVHFYNAALAIVAGCGAAAVSFRLLPPLSPALRTRRLLQLSLRDLRRLARGPIARQGDDWACRIQSRLVVLPDEAQPQERAQLVTAMTVGSEIIRLRRSAPHLGLDSQLESALYALAEGDTSAAIARLAELDHRLADRASSESERSILLRQRGRVLAVSDALEQHRAYFDGACD